MKEKVFKSKVLLLLLAVITIVGLSPIYPVHAASAQVYLDSSKGNDENDGLSQNKAVKTFDKAMEKVNDGDTLNVVSLSETNVKVTKKATLKFLNDTTMTGTGTGIELASGAHVTVVDGKKLTMSGYSTAINVAKGAEINDGNYDFKFAKNGFAFQTSGNIIGTSKDKLKMDITNGYFKFNNADNEFKNATMNQKYEGDEWQLYEWNGFKVINSNINLYRLPVYFKGPLFMDNSKFVVDGTGVDYQTGAYFENSWTVGTFHFTNNSIFEVKNFNTHWRAKGITFGYGNKVLVDTGAKIVVKNNKNGGLNANEGVATFNGGYIEGDGHAGSLFGAQDKENTKVVFGADSVVNTPMKASSDNGLGQSGTNYIVTGGSHKVFYDSSYYGGLAVPVNGEENGNEKLTWFKLKDSKVNELKPINKLGNEYSYSVKNPSDDGNKYVWTPATKVTFKLNNSDASFADKTSSDKVFKTIRGYNLDTVEGNTKPTDPTDKNGVKFLGWFYKTASGEEKKFDWDGKLTADTEVYAKWERNTVIYHNGNGKNYIASVAKKVKEAKVLSFDDIVKKNSDFKVPGKKFIGWSTSPDGKSKAYKAGSAVAFEKGQTQIDLYAQYTDNEYTVSFSANGGTFSEGSVFKKNKDVFTVKQDANGGDVAVLKKKAKYNDKLFSLLGTLDHNQLKPDAKATKTGFKLGNSIYFYTNENATATAPRFDDYTLSFFGRKRTIKGKDPQITTDTTYYLSWNDNVPQKDVVSAQESLSSDMYGADASKSKDVETVVKDKPFSLTGAIDVSSIKQQMSGIESMFSRKESDFDKIALTAAKSTFTATLTLPDEVIVPTNPTINVDGLGKCFEVKETKVDGQKVTVIFKLKDGMTNYKKLKDAVSSTGIKSTDRAANDNNNIILVTVNGLKLKNYDKLTDGQKLTATGIVTGDFSAVAKNGNTIKKFSFTWNGKQTEAGKDNGTTGNGITFTFIVSKPTELTLGGDLLVKKGTDEYNTEHENIYSVDKDDSLTLKGALDVSSIKTQINALKEEFEKNHTNESGEITTKGIKSTFVATLELPEGLSLPSNPSATLTNNDLFAIKKEGGVKVEGKKIIVTMTLKKANYEKFTDLYNDVTKVKDTLEVEVPVITVAQNATGTLTVKGSVSGTFVGEATYGSKTKTFNYKWTGVQTDAGKDFMQAASDAKSIQLTMQLPTELTLDGDILIGEDTEHDALHKVHQGDSLEYTGRLNVSSIKSQIEALKTSYSGDSGNITTQNIKSTFVATLDIPQGLEIPTNPTATLTENNLFEVKQGAVTKGGNKIVVTMTLKKNYNKFADLYNDVTSVPNTLDLKVPNITVAKNATGNLTVKGEVVGTFTGVATVASGKKEAYNFKWTAVQTEEGKDFLIRDQSGNKTIQFTVAVQNPDPTPNPSPNPDPQPTPQPEPEPAPSPEPAPKKDVPNNKNIPQTPKKKRVELVKTGVSVSALAMLCVLSFAVAGFAGFIAVGKKRMTK